MDRTAVVSSPCLLNDTYSNLKPAFCDSSVGTMKSTLTAPMPPIAGDLPFARSMNCAKLLISDLPFTTMIRSSEASSATGVKLRGCQGVLACSGVVMKLPLVVEMWYGLPFWLYR